MVAYQAADHSADENLEIAQGLEASHAEDSQLLETPRLEQNTTRKESPESDARLKRQIGDWATWLYYAKSVGLWQVVSLLLFVLLAVLSSNFPREWCKTLMGNVFADEKQCYGSKIAAGQQLRLEFSLACTALSLLWSAFRRPRCSGTL